MLKREFVVFLTELNLNEADVRAGSNKAYIVKICRCINVALFVSGNLRRDVRINAIFGHHSEMQMITFDGETLKRVSPDERSISFFLLKTRMALENHRGKEIVMDNGIIARRISIDSLVEKWSSCKVYIANNKSERPAELNGSSQEVVLMYNLDRPYHPRLSELRFSETWRPQSPERYILEWNRNIDYYLDGSLKKAS